MKNAAFLGLALAIANGASAFGQDQAPPPTRPVLTPSTAVLSLPRGGTAGLQLYSIGNPTAQEQLYVEYINRARANPVAEATRLSTTTDPDVLRAYSAFQVNLVLMTTQFALIPAAPPLAMNPKLMTSARAHTKDMYDHQFQEHNGTDGSTPASRISGAGYAYSTAGENIFSYAYSTFYGHAGFEVDWGGDPVLQGGMQTPPGHRNNIHLAAYREIGVGVIDGQNGSVGPELVTQDFGVQQSSTPFVTGVVYSDKNNNGFYDVGEGISGVTVTVSGSNYYAVTGQSGGYSVPVAGSGTYTVSFSGGGVPDTHQNATVSSGRNVKADYVAVAPTPTPTPTVPPTALGNISTRSIVGTGNNALIGGFIVSGTHAKKVIVRAIGPSLPLANRLANPRLELRNSSGVLIASNDDWQQSPDKQAIIDSTVAPTNPLESAIVATLPANNSSYTAVVNGVNDQTGVGLVEVYDLDRSVDSTLASVSTRGFVLTGNNVMIAGFYVVGSGAQKVIVRVLGPSLAVAGKLANPRLELRNSNGVLVAQNDNWRSTQQAEIIASTVAPPNDAESAIVQTLTPGKYTAVVSGVNSTSGIGLVEAYALK
jgi:hypothetical protein